MKFFLGIVFVTCLAFVMLLATEGLAYDNETQAIMNARKNALPIPYKQLKSEDSYPYLQFGKTLQERKKNLSASDYRKYKQAVDNFPNVHSCLEESERTKEHPNLNLFDWHGMPSIEEAEVCLFRIFASIDNLENAQRWVEIQGFKISTQLREVPQSITRLYGDSGVGYTFGAGWSMKDKGSPLYRKKIMKLSPLQPYSLTMSAKFNSRRQIINTQLIYNSL